MARFSDETINRIKQEVSLVRLVENSGVELKPHGKDKIGRCPFHNDKTPSLVISPSNLWNCLGACQMGGSVIDWVIKSQGISFRHAVELLKNDIPALAAPAQPVKKSTTKKLDVLLSEDAEAQQLLNQVTTYYHETIKQSPEALAYLESRGLGNSELIDRFKLGYVNRTLGYRLPEKNRKAGAQVRGKLQEVGIIRSSGHEHFNGSVVVPIFNSEGNVVEMYGRKILGNKLRKGTPQHMYLPGEHAGVWNGEGLDNQKEVILCEALIDAMTFWVNGYRNVTASYGTSGFTTDHLSLFKHCGVERILIAYDRDDAGNNAAEKLSQQLQKEGIASYRINFPKNMDANQYAQEVTPASKSLGVVIRSAQWMGEAHQQPKRELENSEQSELSSDVEKGLNLPSLAASLVVEPEMLPPAEAQPEPPKNDIQTEANDREINFTFGVRKYRIRGLEKNKNYEVLKVNVLVRCEENMHVDTFDLYSAKHRYSFIKVAALEIGEEENTLKKDLGRILLKVEELQENLINGSPSEEKQAALSDDDKTEALALLQDPRLLDRILSDFNKCGVVGEEVNKLVGYLAAGSRKLDRPLAVIIQSTSAAGKSSLMDAVLNLMPENERLQYSAMTGQSLYYMGQKDLKHKILAISEEEGASNASYALKLLQSEGEVTIASTGKDDATGDLVTKEYKVEGPVMLFLTTTAITVDEELLNRCLVLTVNESREQTQAIHHAQRKRRTLDGLQSKIEKDHLVKLHRNAQSLLKPLAIINPYADQLTFLSDKTRMRRDHEKYLTLIDAVAMLHQYQRPVKTINHVGKNIEYIEVELSDIETANRLAHEVLGRTLDELPAQTRKLLNMIKDMVSAECEKQNIAQADLRFSRRDVRTFTGWSDNQLKVHCMRLTELEYLLVHRGGRGQHLVYELLFNGGDHDHPQMMGLIDVEKLGYDEQKLGVTSDKLASSCTQDGTKLEMLKPLNGKPHKALHEASLELPQNIVLAKNNESSNRNVNQVAVS
jgi:DNA primase catalytic core